MSDNKKSIVYALTFSLVTLILIGGMVYFGTKQDISDTEERCYEKGRIVEVDYNGKKYCDSGRDIYHID